MVDLANGHVKSTHLLPRQEHLSALISFLTYFLVAKPTHWSMRGWLQFVWLGSIQGTSHTVLCIVAVMLQHPEMKHPELSEKLHPTLWKGGSRGRDTTDISSTATSVNKALTMEENNSKLAIFNEWIWMSSHSSTIKCTYCSHIAHTMNDRLSKTRRCDVSMFRSFDVFHVRMSMDQIRSTRLSKDGYPHVQW